MASKQRRPTKNDDGMSDFLDQQRRKAQQQQSRVDDGADNIRSSPFLDEMGRLYEQLAAEGPSRAEPMTFKRGTGGQPASPITEVEEQAKEREKNLRAELRGHKLIPFHGMWACANCLQVYTVAGRSRAAAERHHERHVAEVKRTFENRSTMPDCFFG
jgi:hypothetical protein